MFPTIWLDETDSTSNYLKKLLQDSRLDEYTLVRADFQTAGRGQRDSDTWESQRRKNLLFSTLLYPSNVEIKNQFIISQVVALAVKNTLDGYADDISVKWPNDIYWKDKKICGTLIENNLMDGKIARSIIGIGININQQEFLGNAPNPVSLWQIAGKEYDIDLILDSVMERIERYFSGLEGNEDAIGKEYKLSLYRRKGYHKYQDKHGTFDAVIKDISPAGYLILEDRNQVIRKYAFKEVKYIM